MVTWWPLSPGREKVKKTVKKGKKKEDPLTKDESVEQTKETKAEEKEKFECPRPDHELAKMFERDIVHNDPYVLWEDIADMTDAK